MGWDDIKDAVADIAPVAGTLLGGPAGSAVGGLIASVLGVENDPEAVRKAIAADPDAAVKLRGIEAELEKTQIEARSQIIQAEASGESWLQRNWRPLVMLWLAGLVGGYWFGFTPDNLTEDTVLKLFDIVQYGLSGYIAGRSAEKIVKTVSGRGLLDNILRKK